ncbi:hypothetical protein NQ317_016546 [Molorchus minor]|uniref:Translation machinery-associated protein 16 n=1 Tax=Molorchus minor TaxID=1323400 RepID=A0ABQ9J8G5_9CUCU|nr:hypothetical protein NQ317_016546 [Molorchus minor]
MVKVKQLEKLKHPNSRKTKALLGQITKRNNRKKLKLSGNTQHGQHVPRHNFEELILKYIGRFDEELEQIRIKHSIGKRKNRQHASREDIINITKQREELEYCINGFEMPNLLDKKQFEILKAWNGDIRLLQNFKTQRFTKKFFEEKKEIKQENKHINSEN